MTWKPLNDFGRSVKWVFRCAKFGMSNDRIFLSTPPGHFYSPLPSHRDLEKYDESPVDNIAGITLRAQSQLELAKRISPLIQDHNLAVEPTEGHRYYLENLYYPYADGLLLQAMIRHLKPRKVVEVGSGFSSAVMLDTRHHHALTTDLTFIDPNPERLQSLLTERDSQTSKIIIKEVQSVPLSTFTSLGEDDILFIDSSHVAKFGSDVNYLFFTVLPVLAHGVWVHIHDIFWPFEYPLSWLKRGWAWNEAYMLRSYLCNNDRLQIQIFPSYLESCHVSFLREHWPQTLQRARQNTTVGGASIWLRVNNAQLNRNVSAG